MPLPAETESSGSTFSCSGALSHVTSTTTAQPDATFREYAMPTTVEKLSSQLFDSTYSGTQTCFHSNFCLGIISTCETSEQTMAPRLIALEEHFYSQAVYGGLDIQFKNTIEGVPRLFDQLRNIDEQRLSAMDEGDVALQVISHAFTPGKKELNCKYLHTIDTMRSCRQSQPSNLHSRKQRSRNQNRPTKW